MSRRVRELVRRAREEDLLLYAAGLAFYSFVSVVPLLVLLMWLASLLLGDQRVEQAARALGELSPEGLGADRAFARVADLGTRLGIAAIVTALWPATSYGAGLARAFDRLSGGKRRMKGLRGRGLFALALLPLWVTGTLVSMMFALGGAGGSGLGRVLGFTAAVVSGGAAAAVGVVLIYRLFPKEPLGGRALVGATATAVAGALVLSLLLAAYLSLGANFREHYVSSSLGAIVLVAVWLFLANAVLLAAYRVARA